MNVNIDLERKTTRKNVEQRLVKGDGIEPLNKLEGAGQRDVLTAAWRQARFLYDALGNEDDIQAPIEYDFRKDLMCRPERSSWRRREKRSSFGLVLANSIIDRAYAFYGQELLRSKKIGISWTTYVDGQGDRAAARKVAEILAPHTSLTIGLRREEDREFFSFRARDLASGERRWNVWGTEELRAIEKEDTDFDLIISLHDQCAFNFYEKNYFVTGKTHRCLNLREYDRPAAYHHANVFETGFGLTSCGVFIDRRLASEASSAREDFRSFYRIHWPGLATGIGLSLTREDEWLADADRVVLHLSYTKKPCISDCIAAHLKFHGSDHRSLAILLVGKKEKVSRAGWENLLDRSFFDSWQVRACEKNGVNEVFSGKDNSGQANQTRRLEILRSSAVSLQVFATAMTMSSFALVTGDQSLSEAVSTGLPIVYDDAGHKWQLGKNLASFARFCPQAARALSGHEIHTPKSEQWQSDALTSIKQVFSGVREHHDLAERLVGRCVKLTMDRDLRALEDSIFRVCATATTTQVPPTLSTAVADLGSEIRASGRPSLTP